MTPPIVEFTAPGSPSAVSAAIEECAVAQRVVSALVVPWESNATTLRMAVTSMKGDGWNVEHTNLGTITLADLGGDRTRVVVVGHQLGPDADRGDQRTRDRLAAVLAAFARQIEQRFARLATQPSR